jgi:hypothetical protein
MMMTYLGGLKSWLYAPLFAMFGTSPWSIRLPALGLAGLTIGLTGYLLCEIGGRAAGSIAIWLLATDVTFLVTAVFDWGPVVLQNLLLVVGLLLIQQWSKHKRPILIFAAGFVFGLALWDKALFFWNLSGMAIAFVLVNARDFVRDVAGNLRRFALSLGLMLLGLALGSAPLIRYNARPGGGTVTKNANLTTKEIVPKAEYLYSALNGITTERNFDDPAYPQSERVSRPLQKLARALISKSGWLYSSWRVPVMLVCLPLGLIFAPPPQRKWILFFLIASAMAWTESALTKEAGGSIHHTVLIWPLVFGAFSLSLGAVYSAMRTWVKIAVVTLVVVLCFRGLLTIATAYAHLLSYSPLVQWSNADQQLIATLLESGVKRIIAIDWGIDRVIAVRSSNRIAVADQTFDLMDSRADAKRLIDCTAPDCAIVTHPSGRIVMHKAADEFAKIVQDLMLKRSDVQVINDTHGVPSYEVFRLIPTIRAK